MVMNRCKFLFSLIFFLSPEFVSAQSIEKIQENTSDNKEHIMNLQSQLGQSNINGSNIENFYKKLQNGAVVEVPRSIMWNGSVPEPDAHKHVTWIFDDKIAGDWSPPAGDGDVSIQYHNGFGVSSRYFQNKSFSYPSDFFFWNDDPNFPGPWSANWQQYSAANFRAISGPVSSGNTSAITANVNSYGQKPSSSYDVGISLDVNKYGQNSTWGLVVDQNDFSGKSPGAFAQWNEYDVWANGMDIQSWDPTYGTPQAGHRSIFFVNAHHLKWPNWKAQTSIKIDYPKQGSLPVPKIIAVHASDGQDYIWYAVSSGTTGDSSPYFPAPAKIVGKASHGILTITKVVSGKIKENDYLTGAVPVSPVRIKNQIYGQDGGVGTYKLDDDSVEIHRSQPMYAAPRVQDNTVVWQFGEEYAMTVSSGLFFTGGDTYDTILAVDKNNTVSNAVIDSTQATFSPHAAAIRMGEGQSIDFSGNSKLEDKNKHTLSYEKNALNYKVDGKTVFSIDDSGRMKSNTKSGLPLFSRKEILKFQNPSVGMEVFDTTDDTVAIYTKKGWKILELPNLPI